MMLIAEYPIVQQTQVAQLRQTNKSFLNITVNFEICSWPDQNVANLFRPSQISTKNTFVAAAFD